MMGEAADTKGVESRDDDKNGCPTVIERERKVDEELVTVRLGNVMLFNDIVYVGYCGANEESKDESYREINLRTRRWV